MFKTIYFEISSKCNARCHWCQTGFKNKHQGHSNGAFVDINEFEYSLDYLLANNILNKTNYLLLYNWGEPLLHPQFKTIIQILNNRNVRYGLSTNASVPVSFENSDDLRNLLSIKVSMPGFSQNSYDKIHGFNFQKILNNIKQINGNFRASGFTGNIVLMFHVYQFNIHEMNDAYVFAQQNGLNFNCTYAFVNDNLNNSRLIKYFYNSLAYDELKKMSQELFLFFLNSFNPNAQNKTKCLQLSTLTIDESCYINLCCGNETRLEKIYNINGNLFKNQLTQARNTNPLCIFCKQSGILNLFANRPSPIFIINSKKE